MVLPLPPYLYDDSRLTYDERCFFYDGGYDSVCLAGPAAIFKPIGGRSSRKNKCPYLNVFIRSCLLEINKVKTNPEDKLEGWIRFSGEEEPMSVFINGVSIKTQTLFEDGYLKTILTSVSELESVNMSMKYLNAGLHDPVEVSVVDATRENKTDNVEVRAVEPYRKIDISCELVPSLAVSVKKSLDG